MGKATVCERTIAYGPQRWRVNSQGQWSVQMFGTFGPEDNMIPRHKWVSISTDRVPKEVIQEANNE